MFGKIFEKLEKMSTRKLLTITISSGIATLIFFIVYATNAQQYFWVLFIVVFACPFSVCIAQLLENYEKNKMK